MRRENFRILTAMRNHVKSEGNPFHGELQTALRAAAIISP